MAEEVPPVPPTPTNVTQPVVPQFETPETVTMPPPELRGRMRAKIPWLIAAVIAFAIFLAAYWLMMPEDEKTDTATPGVDTSLPRPGAS